MAISKWNVGLNIVGFRLRTQINTLKGTNNPGSRCHIYLQTTPRSEI